MFYDIDFEGYLQVEADEGLSKTEVKDMVHDLLFCAIYRLSTDDIHIKIIDAEERE